MSVYVKNKPAKFHPDPIWNWNDWALGFFEESRPKKMNKNNSNQTRLVAIWDQIQKWEGIVIVLYGKPNHR